MRVSDPAPAPPRSSGRNGALISPEGTLPGHGNVSFILDDPSASYVIHSASDDRVNSTLARRSAIAVPAFTSLRTASAPVTGPGATSYS